MFSIYKNGQKSTTHPFCLNIPPFLEVNLEQFQTGTLLLAQKLHTERVQQLKCNTYMPPRYLGVAEQVCYQEERKHHNVCFVEDECSVLLERNKNVVHLVFYIST